MREADQTNMGDLFDELEALEDVVVTPEVVSKSERRCGLQ